MPLTLVLLGLIIVSFLVMWVAATSPHGSQFFYSLMFWPASWSARPWTFITYPFVEGDFLALVFVGIGLYFFTGVLERTWGTKRFAGFFIVIVFACAAMMLLGQVAFSRSFPLAGMGYPVACGVVAYCSIHPNQPIMLWMVIPIAAKWIGWLTALLIVFNYGRGYPPIGILAGLPVLFSWAYATERLRLPGMPTRPRTKKVEDDYRGFDEDRRMETELERRKLKELFERSFDDDELKDK